MRRSLIGSVAVLLLLTSCISSTRSFTTGFTADPSLEAGAKLEMAGSEELLLPYPESYFDASAFLDCYIEIVENTEDYLFISTFMATYCDGLDELYTAIARKAEEGVRVYMIMDGISSLDMTESRKYMTPVYFLRESGVHLLEYSSISAMTLFAPQTLLIRDHRKLVVSDGKVAALGGMNMNYISMGADNVDLQRDSMYVFESASLASALSDEFVTLWNEASVEKMDRSDFADAEEPETGLELKGYLFNQGPGSESHMSDMYSSLISSAKEEIVLLPYLAFFDDEMYAALKAAQERGVNVKILLPIDTREYVQKATLYDYHNLVEAGFEVWYEYTGGDTGKPLLHQKLAVVDGRYTVIGSTNFNYRSMALSYEISLVIDSCEFAAESLAQVEGLQQGMTPLDLETALEMKREKGNLFMYLFSFYGG